MMFLVLLFASAFATTCPAGQGLPAGGTECAACEADVTFSDANDGNPCANVKTLDQMNCAADKQVLPGTVDTDRTCGTCLAGTAAVKAADSPARVEAGLCTACEAGKTFANAAGATECEAVTMPTCADGEQVKEGTASADRSCGQCPAGSAAAKKAAAAGDKPAVAAGLCTVCAKGFAATAGLEKCTDFKTCDTNGVKTAGTTTADAVCCTADEKAADTDGTACTMPKPADASSAAALGMSFLVFVASLL